MTSRDRAILHLPVHRPGDVFKQAIDAAAMEYLSLMPGEANADDDDDTPEEQLSTTENVLAEMEAIE